VPEDDEETLYEHVPATDIDDYSSISVGRSQSNVDPTSPNIVINPKIVRHAVFTYVSSYGNPCPIVRYNILNVDGGITHLYYEYVWNESKVM
jgi:hypothetical protein